MNILFELDPNVVKPGWTPLLILIGLALVMVLLFRSMKRQFARVDTNFPEAALPDRPGSAPDSPPGDPAEQPGTEVSTSAREVLDEDPAPRR